MIACYDRLNHYRKRRTSNCAKASRHTWPMAAPLRHSAREGMRFWRLQYGEMAPSSKSWYRTRAGYPANIAMTERGIT